MDKNIEIIVNFRKYLLTKIEGLTVDQLNFIPAQGSDNIVWNLAHMTAVLQALCYRSSELPLQVEDDKFYPFLPGTRPSSFVTENEIKVIKQQFISTVHQVASDLEAGVFTKYNKVEKIEKVYHIKVESVDDAIKYVTHHDGIHYNAIGTLIKTMEYSFQQSGYKSNIG